MRCDKCAEAREFSEGAVWCVRYGMIIRADHECSLPGAHKKTADAATPAGAPSETDERSDINEL